MNTLQESPQVNSTVENESWFIITKQGDKQWVNKDRKLHRLEEPAIETKSGYKQWWLYGELHCDDDACY